MAQFKKKNDSLDELSKEKQNSIKTKLECALNSPDLRFIYDPSSDDHKNSKLKLRKFEEFGQKCDPKLNCHQVDKLYKSIFSAWQRATKSKRTDENKASGSSGQLKRRSNLDDILNRCSFFECKLPKEQPIGIPLSIQHSNLNKNQMNYLNGEYSNSLNNEEASPAESSLGEVSNQFSGLNEENTNDKETNDKETNDEILSVDSADTEVNSAIIEKESAVNKESIDNSGGKKRKSNDPLNKRLKRRHLEENKVSDEKEEQIKDMLIQKLSSKPTEPKAKTELESRIDDMLTGLRPSIKCFLELNPLPLDYLSLQASLNQYIVTYATECFHKNKENPYLNEEE